jgi:hypothetical protein
MTFWIAIGFGVFCALFSLWLWFFGYQWSMRHWTTTRSGGVVHTPESIRRWAKVWAVGGAIGTALMLWASSLGGTTLVETEVAGSSGLLPGEKIHVGKIEFVVEHPDVKHKLQVWPKEADDAVVAQRNFGVVSFVVKVTDPSGKQIHFENVTAQNGKMAESFFTPTENGPHTLEVATLTRSIPKIHVLLSDPKKKDGKRIKGY